MGGQLYKKTTPFLYVLEDQGRELEIASGRLRNGPGTACAPGRSFANQNPSVLERFGAPWPWATNLLPGDSGIALVPPELLDARLLIKKHSVFERCGTPDPETEYQLPGDLEAVLAPLGLLEACSPIVQPSVFKLSGTPKP